MNKLGKMGTGGMVLLIVGIAVGLHVTGIFPLDDILSGFGGTADGDDDGGIVTGQCLTTDKTTVTFDEVDILDNGVTVQTTADTDDGIVYSLNGGALQPSTTTSTSVDDGGTVTLVPKDIIKAYFAYDDTGTAGSHYAEVVDHTVGCVGAETVEARVYKNYTAGTLTWKIENDDNGLINAGNTGNDTFSADNEFNINIDVQGPNAKAALPYGGVLVCGYNSTQYTKFDMQSAGSNLASSEIPDSYTVRGTGFKDKAWEFPSVIGTEKLNFNWNIETGANWNDIDADSSNIICDLFDYDYVYDNDENMIVLAVEDPDDDSDLGSGGFSDGAPEVTYFHGAN